MTFKLNNLTNLSHLNNFLNKQLDVPGNLFKKTITIQKVDYHRCYLKANDIIGNLIQCNNIESTLLY